MEMEGYICNDILEGDRVSSSHNIGSAVKGEASAERKMHTFALLKNRKNL